MQARYVKCLIDAIYPDSNVFFSGAADVQVLDSPGTNLATSATATASSQASTSYVPANLIDGATGVGHEWAAAQRSDGAPNGVDWFIVDLGSVKNVSAITIKSITYSGYGIGPLKAYRLYTSIDGSTYTIAGQVTNGAQTYGRVDTFPLATAVTVKSQVMGGGQ